MTTPKIIKRLPFSYFTQHDLTRTDNVNHSGNGSHNIFIFPLPNIIPSHFLFYFCNSNNTV